MCHLSVGCVVTAVCGLILMSSGGWADDSGLVARYCFDEPAGETVLDQSGHGHAGRVCGAVRVPSPRGQALRFDGRDDYVDCGGPEGLQLSGDLTIEAWVRPNRVRRSISSTTTRFPTWTACWGSSPNSATCSGRGMAMWSQGCRRSRSTA